MYIKNIKKLKKMFNMNIIQIGDIYQLLNVNLKYYQMVILDTINQMKQLVNIIQQKIQNLLKHMNLLKNMKKLKKMFNMNIIQIGGMTQFLTVILKYYQILILDTINQMKQLVNIIQQKIQNQQIVEQLKNMNLKVINQ